DGSDIRRHFDRIVLERGIGLRQFPLMELRFEFGELQAVCSADHYNTRRAGYHLRLDELDCRGKGHTRLRIVEESEPIHFRAGANKFGFGLLFDNTVCCTQRLDRLSETDRVTDAYHRR